MLLIVLVYLYGNFSNQYTMTLFDDTQLFTSGEPRTETFEVPDAVLILHQSFFNRQEADHYYNTFLHHAHWKQHEITVYHKTHLTPRLTAWYGDHDFSFSNHTLHPNPWLPELLQIKEKVEKTYNARFNSVLLNLYRSGQDGVGWHRDNEKEFGPNPIIASVSFGETRPFRLRHKFRKDLPPLEIPLTHGSFLLMAGPTQHYWEHAIPKTAKPIQPRINLTFRLINE